MDPAEQRSHSLADLVAACREATRRFLSSERTPGAGGTVHAAGTGIGALSADAGTGSPCFELFRRAVAERDHAAWEAVMQQYGGLVLAWVRRHPTTATRP